MAKRFALLLILLAALAGPTTAQNDCIIFTNGTTHLRHGPSAEDFGVKAWLPASAYLTPIGRNVDHSWYYVAFDGNEGWVNGEAVAARQVCYTLPVEPEPDLPPYLVELRAVPILPALDVPHLRAIFERGQSQGSNPRSFAKIGDCNTESVFFLYPLDTGHYALGPYAETLQATVEHFAGSFGEQGVAAWAGNTTAAVLDPIFADPERCYAEESPLSCEYRRLKPAVALIGLGTNDIRALSLAEYETKLRQVLDITIEAGIIPVLNTFIEHTNDRWESTLAFNYTIVELAEAYEVPVINFWRAARGLPDSGLEDARSTRLSYDYGGSGAVELNLDAGQEEQWGHALHNLLTLQTLDMLRAEVLTQAGNR